MPDAILTPDQIARIDAEVAAVARHGFGEVVLVIERGRLRWLRATQSYDFGTPPGAGPGAALAAEGLRHPFPTASR